MKNYKQLTAADRKAIEILLNEKHKELIYGLLELKALLVKPDQVRKASR